MKKSKGFINFLAGFSNVILILAIFSSAILIITFWIQILTSSHGMFDVSHEFSVPLKFDAELILQNGNTLQNTIETSSLKIPIMLYDQWGLIIFYFAILLFLMSTMIYFLLQFKKIFYGLKNSMKEGTYFHGNLYKHIQRLAYCIFAFVFIDLLNKLFFFLYIEEIQTMGQNLHPHLAVGSEFGRNVVFGIILLIIAEIYKEGLTLKQENQLTI